ncbi:hypothetical protein BJ138DRAFT_1087628 [Hygrophoropsis aurantiaca]|uniref:Uncharacterized protein n=1 Tax=Hygrophoropsis aurantiaca TaxID=72124 RepID=A0ACB8AB55_9AGAM|nr:hypothetical protein BJ138DRAFT_1087628 [Hygrophoropsis aurantiaca]
MSNLRNILNAEDNLQSNYKPSPGASSASPPSPISDSSTNTVPESSHYTREDPPFPEHEYHPNCPDTLACLPDTDGRPQHTLPVILRCAILGSPRKRLTIREIYAAMEEKYLYFRTAGPTWKQSVRHHLSLNRLFERQPRPVTEPGFGSYWTVNLEAPPGTKRPRKRGRSNKTSEDNVSSLPQRKRGRPRKFVETSLDATTRPSSVASDRPPHSSRISAIRTIDERSEHDDECEEKDDTGMSEEEYESEEDMIVPPNHQPSIASMSIFGGQQPSTRVFCPTVAHSTVHDMSKPDSVLVDCLQMEISGLRRQSADAVSVSLRISDQLAEAQAEAARAKAALRTMETMLEEEERKRREAERIADEETRLRRATEDSMARMQRQWYASGRTM